MLVTSRPARRRRAAAPARGFTLVELGAVIGVLAIVAAIAMPGFHTFMDTTDAKNASLELVADLSAARSEALKRNAAVSVLPLSGNWTHGWEVRIGGEVLGQRKALRSGTWLSAPTAGITFQPNGRLSDDETAVANIRWSVISTHTGVAPRCVVILPTGSARATRGSC